MSGLSSALLAQAASLTSSGFADGLGRRSLAFDREEGAMLERLSLRPELGAFESMLRERLDCLAAREDERIARPRTIERDLDGSLVVTSEFVPGSRLADLLETSAETGTVPGVDAAVGFLLDVLPALCGLHAGAGFAHGSIAPSRTVLTPAGQIVLLDAIYGGALTRLRYSRHKLWTEFAVATPHTPGTPRLEVAADIAQSALAALMLVLGRPLRTGEYPDNPTAVLREVDDAAEIRGGEDFATGLRTFIERALVLPGRTAYAAVDDALFDVRVLAGELGPNVCRRALIDFIEQMESPSPGPRPVDDYDDLAQEIASYGLHDRAAPAVEEEVPAQDLEAAVDAELDLDGLVGENEQDEYELDEVPEAGVADSSPAMGAGNDAPGTAAEDVVDWIAAAAESDRSAAEKLFAEVAPQPAGTLIEAAPSSRQEQAVARFDLPLAGPAAEASADEAEEAQKSAVSPVRSRRAKRAPRSARAPKDKLRSAAEAEIPALVKATVPPPPAAKKAASPWMVAPDRAAAFEPIVEAAPAAPASVPVTTAFTPVIPPPPVNLAPVMTAPPVMPPIAVVAPPPVAPVPVYAAPPPPSPVQPPPFSRTVGAIAPSYANPPAWTPTPAPPPTAQPHPAPLKFKDAPGKQRVSRPDPVSDIYSSPSGPLTAPASEPTAFPWKLAAALIVIVLGAIIGGKVYLPAKGVTPEETSSSSTSTPVSPRTTALPAPAGAASTGRLEIDTQPAGARILLDGKPAGESPIALDGIPAGRHTVTLISSSGSVKRTIRIEAGRTAKVDIPIFSGWVGIYAPFVVEVVEGGKVIGTTEEPRLMLSPGKHDLTLVNRELGYSSAQSVDIEPGEVKSISIDPRGMVNLNAVPWAEVWIDGRKAGDTPMANLQLPLGIREITFRHPQLGDRRVSVTVKASAPAAVSIDLTKPEL